MTGMPLFRALAVTIIAAVAWMALSAASIAQQQREGGGTGQQREFNQFQPQDVVIVAHSAGGMYLPLVAERWPPRRMVFLAAVIPRPGLSMIDQFRSDPSMLNPAWIGKNPMDDEVALNFTLHDFPRSVSIGRYPRACCSMPNERWRNRAH
jgi:hypothetical protein